MKILCPECQTSINLRGGEVVLECDNCGLSVDISKLGTSPGMMPVPVVRDFSGEIIGQYQLNELIGIGGMGVVYRATRTSDQAVVAVKILSNEVEWKREAFVARFKREAEALKRLDHPNVVSLIDSGEQDGCSYLVTEYVEGQNLALYLRSHTLTINKVVEVMAQVCEAITYAHSNGIVHRDIKPANIIVSKDVVKVLDFGLAQITGKDSGLTTLTRTDLAMGTINYLSPEQRLNAKNVDERSDIFSLGIVFFEMLTGTLPLGSFEPPSKIRKDAPKRCNHIVNRSLNTNPDLRYQNVNALRDDLLGLLSPRALRKPLAFAAVAVLALLAGGLAAKPYLESKLQEKQLQPVTTPIQTHSASQETESQQKQPEIDLKNIGLSNNDIGRSNAPFDFSPVQKAEEPKQQAQVKDNKNGIKKPKPSSRSRKQNEKYLERLRQLKEKKRAKKNPTVKPASKEKTYSENMGEPKQSKKEQKKSKKKKSSPKDETNALDDYLIQSQSSK